MKFDIQRQQARTNPTHSSLDPWSGSECSSEKNLSFHKSTTSLQDVVTSPESEKGVFQAEKVNDPEAAKITTNLDDDEVTYPEGGLQAWLVVLGSFCAMFACFGMMNTIGTLNAYISTHQLKDYAESSIGWIFSLYVFLSFFCGLQIGPIFDAKGPRALVIAGSVCIVASMLLLGLCTQYYHFILVFGILGGLGTSLLFTPAVASIAHYFNRRRATQTGLAACGGSFGGVIFPLMLQSLFPKVGFAWATRILGFIFILLCGIAILLVRSRLPPKKGGRSSSILPDFTIFKDGTGALALTTAAVFFIEWGLFIPITYLTSYALTSGVDPTFSYQLTAIFNGASCFGRYLPGFAADYIGRFNTMIITVFLCLASALGLWLPAHGNVAVIVVFSVVFGFSSGSNISLTPTCVGQLCRTEEYGRYYATCYTIVSFGTLTGIPIAGAIISMCNDAYWGVVVFTGCCYFASLVCLVAVRVIKAGCSFKTVY